VVLIYTCNGWIPRWKYYFQEVFGPEDFQTLTTPPQINLALEPGNIPRAYRSLRVIVLERMKEGATERRLRKHTVYK
jgi:hypothetical protein